MITILTAGQVWAIDFEPIVTLAQPFFTLGIWVVAKFSSLTSTSDFPCEWCCIIIIVNHHHHRHHHHHHPPPPPHHHHHHQSRATQPTVHAGCFSVSVIHRTLTWTTGSLKCTQMLMHAIAHGGVRTPLESVQWKWSLGERSLATLRNRTCVGDVRVRHSANWATSPPHVRKIYSSELYHVH